MTADELKNKIEKHRMWLCGNEDGKRADLRYTNLQGADLRNADLQGADLQYTDLRNVALQGADLRNADLQGADLRYTDLRNVALQGADLQYTDLRYTNLQGADLRNADMQGADLQGADLQYTDLRNADLQGACLRNADLRNADLQGAEYIPFVPMSCPDEGDFIGWKKALNGKQEVIVKLLVTGRRSSSTGRKCRCDRATVIAIESIDGVTSYDTATSKHDKAFVYIVGNEVKPKEPFCGNRWNECASGIHFFINRQEAVEYTL